MRDYVTMIDFQSLFQAHPKSFCSFIFQMHSNLKLFYQIQIHIIHAPSNVNESCFTGHF